MNNIIWLASYPKSGNTWFRLFLHALQNKEAELNINAPKAHTIASSRHWFENAVGYDSADLTAQEIERLRPRVYEHTARQYDRPHFHKIHDAYTYTDRGEPLVSNTATFGVIYILRNPLDVCVSLAYHSGHGNFEKTLRQMMDKEHYFAAHSDRQASQLPQRLLDWSGHVLSWTQATDIPCCIIRYEDMHASPVDTFGKALHFAGIDAEEQDIRDALNKTSFSKLAAQEQVNGFNEKPGGADRFFRRGIVGGWREALSEEQVNHFIEKNQAVMRQFGYIDDNNQVID
ncbi:sulfotransferase domain-containing protein [Photobacterium kasasachensis]|uniref:sulfotransferase domain-containing protein n=1 Tax=Photobacterium kasasachensis TaxID=2910240 RepID=UPI003D0D3EBA